MRQIFFGILVFVFLMFLSISDARAEFIISSAIIEFNNDSPTNQDIELISRSKDNDYIETEVSEIIHPGQSDETRKVIEDPTQGSLLVTPDKTILSGGSRKILRFVLLKEPDQEEHVYRVKVQPVIKGVDNNDTKIGLKILVGYEVLTIVRPVSPRPDYQAIRTGRVLKITNLGNTNILFQSGKQCSAIDACKSAPVIRVYAGTEENVTLPTDDTVQYSVWDGKDTKERSF